LRRLLLVAVLAGCSHPAETGGVQLRIAAAGDLAPLGPRPMSSYSTFAQDWVYQGLVRLEADGSVKLILASRLDRVTPKSMRAWIRPDAKFSDGSPVQVEDVVASVTSGGFKARVEDGSVVIESDAVFPETALSRLLIYKTVRGMALGSGPFAVVEQDASHILLRRTRRLAHHIGEVVIRTFKNPREAFLATLSGNADSYPLIDPKQLEFFEGVPRFRILEAPTVNAIAVTFSTKRLDRATRLALVSALQPRELARLAYPAGCTPLETQGTPFHPLPSGRPLNIGVVLSASSAMERMALAVQRALGPRAGDIERWSFSDFQRGMATGDFDLFIETPIAWPESEQAILWRTDSPLFARHYSNPKVDAAIDAGDWDRALKELAEDPPVDFICLPPRLAIIDRRFKNARIGPFGFFESLPEWEADR